MELLYLRVIERILAVIIGGLSIYLGYRLFIRLPRQKDSSGKVNLPGDVSIFLSRIGPGVFFSLFGAAVVIVSLQHALNFELANKASVTAETSEKVANLKVRYIGDAADWGDFRAFRNWVNDGGSEPVPSGVSPEAIKIFRQTRE